MQSPEQQPKQYVKDQSDEWKTEYYLPVMTRTMRVDYNGGKKYKLHESFQKVYAPLQEEFNSNYHGVNYNEELQLLISHAARTVKNGKAVPITLRKANFDNQKASYTKFLDLLNELYHNNYGQVYIGNREIEEPVEVKTTFSKKAGKQYKTVKAHRSLFVWTEKFQNLFLGIPNKHYPPKETVSTKDYVQQRITVDKVDSKGNVVLNDYGKPEKVKKRKEGKLRGSTPFKEEMKRINEHNRGRLSTRGGSKLEDDPLKRLFGESWNEYGRLYNRYSTLAKKIRRALLIDLEEVVECDFESMHPRMLAEMEGHYLPDNFKAYETENRSNILYQIDPSEHRSIYKIALIACLSAKSKEGLTNSVFNGLKKSGYKLPNGLASRIVEDLKQHNQVIAHCFGADMSKTLQNKDSNIAIKVMLGLADEGIGFLPYHDSFLVPKSKENVLKDLMRKAWESELHSAFNCIITSTTDDKENLTASHTEVYIEPHSTDYHIDALENDGDSNEQAYYTDCGMKLPF